MPLGSSSAAPVIRPGPRRLSRFGGLFARLRRVIPRAPGNWRRTWALGVAARPETHLFHPQPGRDAEQRQAEDRERDDHHAKVEILAAHARAPENCRATHEPCRP